MPRLRGAAALCRIDGVTMSTQPPLTHHQIIALVEPFTRRGWAVDLPASDRAQRRIDFRARQLDDMDATLRLSVPEPGHFELTRTLRGADGLQAELHAEGPQPAELLERIEAVPAQRQFHQGDSVRCALRQRLPRERGDLVLREAEARLPGLSLQMRLSGVSGYPAELELRRDEGAAIDLPDDLLAVLGRAWSHLGAVRGGWQGSVMLRGKEPRRSADAEARLQQTLQHLARTLAEPPARFHERHAGARWRVALRGTVPLAVCGAIVGTAVLLQGGDAGSRSALGLLANVTPPLLMGLFFLRREMPRIAWPRPPRCPAATAWPVRAAAAPSYGAARAG